MSTDQQPLLLLAQKVQGGTSTPDEESQLIQSVNHSTELLLSFIEKVKESHANQQTAN